MAEDLKQALKPEYNEYRDILAALGVAWPLSESPELRQLIALFIAPLKIYKTYSEIDKADLIGDKIRAFFGTQRTEIIVYQVKEFFEMPGSLHVLSPHHGNPGLSALRKTYKGELVLVREDQSKPGYFEANALESFLTLDDGRWFELNAEQYKQIRPSLRIVPLPKKLKL